ncbi:MAG: lipopolysaccharide biosynthesis protein [Thermoanaerobaculales bacterium]|nr:lipopolysaccharide biosynthesis protein [Thermoanaerobaculales bacterium]
MTGSTRRIATGVGWLYGYRWVERIIDFASVVVLARILAPDDFGLVAIAASVVTIIEGLSAFDVTKALIRHRDDDRSLYDTAWTLSALRGLLAAVIMIVISLIVDDPRIAAILVALALSPILTGLANPRFVMFERDLVYSRLAILTLGARILAFAVTVVIAVLTRSYWALVIGMLAGTLASLVLGYVLRPFRPRPSLARFGDIFAFSGWLSLTSVVTTLAMETDKIIVGRLLGITEAGYYFMTQRIGVLPTRELVSPLQRILFPSFSELVADTARLRQAALESVNVIGTLSLPAGFGFALIAGDFVPLVLGDQWASTVPLLVVLVPYLGFRATLSMALPCVMALGRTRLLFGVSLVYGLIHLPLFIGCTAAFGLSGAIWSIVGAGVVYTALNAWMLHRCLGLGPGELAIQLRRPLAAALAMVGAVLGLRAALPSAFLAAPPSWVSLAGTVVVGATVFTAVVACLWRVEGRPPGLERRLLDLRPSPPE